MPSLRPNRGSCLALAAAVPLAACVARPPVTDREGHSVAATGGVPVSPGTRVLDPSVSVARVAPGLWVHVTLDPASGFPSNGMILETDSGSLLLDTAWNDRQTDLLLGWASGELRKPVRRAIITHSHNDRLGGLGALRRAGIPAAALGATVQRAAAAGLLAPAGTEGTPGGGADPVAPLDSIPGLALRPERVAEGVELYYPGAGHSPDNIVAYFRASGVLFGGCLLKPDTASTVGNVADADVTEWPRAVARVAAHFPDARAIVPGHGAVSGRGALDVTAALITAKGPAAVEELRRRRPNRPE